jgi:hypothetical protein
MSACGHVCVHFTLQAINLENMESLVGSEVPVQFLDVDEVRICSACIEARNERVPVLRSWMWTR